MRGAQLKISTFQSRIRYWMALGIPNEFKGLGAMLAREYRVVVANRLKAKLQGPFEHMGICKCIQIPDTMQLRIAALADYTNVTDNGKLNILGIFSQIHAVSLPAVHPQMQFVVQFAFEPIEAGDKTIAIILQDADGVELLKMEGRLSLPAPESPDPIVVNQIVVLQNVVFPHFGNYEFVIEVDGETIPAHVPVDILPAQNPN